MADLKLAIDTSTAVERAAVAAVIAAEDVAVQRETERLVRGGLHRRAERRHLLLPGLHALQRASGWISPGGLNHLCDLLQVPPADAYGVATFYALFRTDDPGHTDPVHHVCMDPACHVADAEASVDELDLDGGDVVVDACGAHHRADGRGNATALANHTAHVAVGDRDVEADTAVGLTLGN